METSSKTTRTVVTASVSAIIRAISRQGMRVRLWRKAHAAVPMTSSASARMSTSDQPSAMLNSSDGVVVPMLRMVEIR